MRNGSFETREDLIELKIVLLPKSFIFIPSAKMFAFKWHSGAKNK